MRDPTSAGWLSRIIFWIKYRVDLKNAADNWVETKFWVGSNNEHWTADEIAWTQQEVNRLNNIFSNLPSTYQNATKGYTFVKTHDLKDDGGGTVFGAHFGDKIIIDDTAYTAGGKYAGFTEEENFRATVVHEMTHAVQEADSTLETKYKDYWTGRGFPWTYSAVTGQWTFNGPAVTGYAYTNPNEHMAEAAAYYVVQPETLKQSDPQTYDWLKDNVFGGKEYLKK